MPLLQLATDSPESVAAMNIQQIVQIAGDGQLKDGSECQSEIRAFLAEVEPENLGVYAQHCLDEPFTDSGLVLQDIVNEIGRRLGYSVTNGRYRGRRNENGFDGLWKSTIGGSLVVETKTTAAYTISLEVLDNYKSGLISEGVIDKNTSVLIVVGRQDTLALEQQVRGSKHAWSMRIVSIDALMKLVSVNLSSLSDEVTNQIHSIFLPIEYTRVDPIVDVVFIATEDKEESDDPELDPEDPEEKEKKPHDRTPRQELELKRKFIAEKFGQLNESKLIKRKTKLFSNAEDNLRASISVSKRYDLAYQNYWYAYEHPVRKYLSECNNSYFVMGCMDKDEAFAIPYAVMEEHKEDMPTTPAKENRKEYWHIYLRDKEGKMMWYLSRGRREIDISEYRFECE